MNFKLKTTALKDLVIVEPEVYHDDRGYYMETFRNSDLGTSLKERFVQDNLSYNKSKFTFRGFHYQKPPYTQSKLVRVVSGSVIDVVVDLRGNSPTYMQSTTVHLDAINNKLLYVPKGFGHAFLTLEDNTVFEYKVNMVYNKLSSVSFNMTGYNIFFDIFNDLKISWDSVLMSDTDSNAECFDESDNPFIDWY